MTREEIARELELLPRGSIGSKKINGKEYSYHRWYENGKRKEKYVSPEAVEKLRTTLMRRKELEAQLKEMQLSENTQSYSPYHSYEFLSAVVIGSALETFIKPVKGWKRRNSFNDVQKYIYGNTDSRVLILFGLRRTGKTTLIRQTIAAMPAEDRGKTAFIQVEKTTTLADVNKDLQVLSSRGYRYVFIDEVTMLDDFIEGCALFSDIFAASGIKIVLSGTDSLGFLFAEDEQLYDRTIMIHTTFIPYHEFSMILGINGIDEYIKYGGTLSLSGNRYNSVFSSYARTDEYVDSAIAKNIQHSLKNYQDGGHFRLLEELYEKNELTSAINRVVEDINHRFTLEVLTRKFRSNDLAISRRNLRNDRNNPTAILDNADIASITERLRHILEIRNKEEISVSLTEAHAAEIKEYLRLLDLIYDIPVINTAFPDKKNSRTIITQPGLRYAQSDALIESLMQDSMMDNISISEKTYIENRIRSEIKGRMTEDIVLLETALSFPEKKVFSLQFAIGEFDMVIFDPEDISCEIFEIKHCDKINKNQYRHLVDKQKCSDTEFRYGTIKGKYVLYRGNSTEIGEIRYLNVEEYLLNLRR